jgi:hypothetical protein
MGGVEADVFIEVEDRDPAPVDAGLGDEGGERVELRNTV